MDTIHSYSGEILNYGGRIDVIKRRHFRTLLLQLEAESLLKKEGRTFNKQNRY